MFLITNKDTKEILMIGNQLDYMSNGYPRLIEENIAFVTEQVDVYELEKIHENIEPYKYCYTEKDGFYENPNWIDPEIAITQTPEYQAGYDQAVLDLMGGDII